MAIAGIEGLAQGLIQGMALKRQNDRQDVLDAQNLERFGMDKERFATQQAASAFDLQNAQTNAANAAIDRTRALGIQKKGDEFEANLGRIFGAGAPENQLMELEKVHQANGVKGAFARDQKTGGLAKSADGKFQWVNEGGSTENVTLEDSIGRYIAKVDPKGEFTRKRTQQDELAKEGREAKRSDAIAARDDKYATKRLYTADAIADGNVKPEKETPLSAADFKSFFGEDYEIGTDANGLPKMGSRINRQLQNRFLTWASVNKRKATMSAYQDWVANDPAAQSLSLNNKNQNIIGAGVLKGYAAPDTSGGAGVDVSDAPKLNLGNQGAAQPVSGAPKALTVNPTSATSNQQDAAPTEESIAKPVTKTQVVSKRQGRGGQMSAPKTIIYQEIQGKFRDPIPDGFKRKKAPFGTDVRTPEYNVFVSKNYDEYND
jgi:hypothetical protein